MANTSHADRNAVADRTYVNWSAVFGGAALAAAYSLLMLTFGAAAGLSFASPFEREGNAVLIALIAVGLWTIWVQVSGFALGGYVAGRMRPRLMDATEHEVEVRDGVHGLLVWATGALLGAIIASTAAGTLVGFGVAALPDVDDGAASARIADTLLRTSNTTRASETTRAEVGRIMTPALAGRVPVAADQAYLTRLVAAETGLSVPEAEARVNAVVAEAMDAAEAARKAAIIVGFITAAALLLGAVGAWWGADMGGHHRDSGTIVPRYWTWRPVVGAAGGAKADDLTEIKGIGSALKQQLYDLDIRTFRQIADFTQKDIDDVSEALSFPGRIEREDWVGQAKEILAARAKGA